MICAKHDWWETENPCPHCPPPDVDVNPAAVTVAETALTGMPDIPEFLRRAPDGSFMYPREKNHDEPCMDVVGCTVAPVPVVFSEQTDMALFEALESSELTLVERQPIYLELRRREDRKKSLARIAEMKDKKAAKESA
jgi:hypothetical protein